jgi:enterochelin esterase-like enzyme
MQKARVPGIRVENTVLESVRLNREILVDLYLPAHTPVTSETSLLLINDGQNMKELGLAEILSEKISADYSSGLLAVAIHANSNRKREYGVAGVPDYLGRGDLATAYTAFILYELLPFLYKKFNISSFNQSAFAGFSLGGLSAFDICWNNPDIFSVAGVFSGSLWWRSMAQEDPLYEDSQHRIIHQQVRNGEYKQGLSFFFQCGNKDETFDRNNNGIIDSVEDTLDLIEELEKKGYRKGGDIRFLELPDGRHDIATWALSVPVFLNWMLQRTK